MDDRAIADAVIAGDREAFRVLVDRESGVVFRTCYRILGERAEAEDAAQESFVIAYRALSTYRGEGTLGAWVARIAARHALRRRSQRRPGTALEPFAEVIPDDGAHVDPLQAALTAERRTFLLDAVAALPQPYREILTLKYFADMSLSEIATLKGRPLGTVKTHLHRGLEHLRRHLDRERSQ